MYKIIGGDGNEYGPVSAEQIHAWIADNRANDQTKARLEGTDEWKALAEFPEFMAALAAQARTSAEPSPAAAPQPFSSAASGGSKGGREAALRAVSGPATALKVTAVLGLICAGLGLVFSALSFAGVQFQNTQLPDPEMQKLVNAMSGVVGVIQSIIGVVVGIAIWKGAVKMQALQNHQFAFVSSILALLPCVSPCCFLGLPFGIWALVVLNQPDVKSQFDQSL